MALVLKAPYVPAPQDKLIHDLEYIADRSIRLYLRVLGATIVRIMRLTSAAGTDNA